MLKLGIMAALIGVTFLATPARAKETPQDRLVGILEDMIEPALIAQRFNNLQLQMIATACRLALEPDGLIKHVEFAGTPPNSNVRHYIALNPYFGVITFHALAVGANGRVELYDGNGLKSHHFEAQADGLTLRSKDLPAAPITDEMIIAALQAAATNLSQKPWGGQ